MKNQLTISLNKLPPEQKNKLISDLINKRIKLEMMVKKNEELLNDINKIKVFFDEKTQNSVKDFVEIKEDFIAKLIEKAKSKSLTKWQKDILSGVINDEFSSIQNLFGLSENAEKMWEDFHKFSQENMSKTEKMMMKEMLDHMKDELDLPDGFDFEKMLDDDYKEEMQKKMHERNFEEDNRSRQDNQFANQQNMDIDFKQLYRKLVKFAHPDLVKSDAEKAEREKVIKRINSAWKDLNYYEIIIIWMEIDPQNEMEVELTKKNCKMMIEHLNQKLREEEYRKYEIKNFNHKTAFIFNNFYAKKEQTILAKIDKFNVYITGLQEETIGKIEDIKTMSGLKNILAHLYEIEIKKQKTEDEMMYHSFR